MLGTSQLHSISASLQKVFACQMVGMSAMIAADSAAKLASWLQAQLYTTTFRPVPLSMYLKAGPCLHSCSIFGLCDSMCMCMWQDHTSAVSI